jgi:hypothetical protein
LKDGDFSTNNLGFGDFSSRLLKDDDVFMNLVDTKCCGVSERAKVVIVFASVPDDDIFQLKSLLGPLLNTVNVEWKELVFLTKVHYY